MKNNTHTPIIKKRKKAFALIMSLFLMSFLVLLVITLSAIVQMELRASKQTLLDQRAKNAAKLAAYQALAEVQKAMGPDQRISANASILDDDINGVFDELENDTSYSFWKYDPSFDRDDINAISGISNPHWVGVWDSTPGMRPMPRMSDEERSDYVGEILKYATNFLVSGNRSIKRDTVTPDSELDLAYSPVKELSTDYINMLRKNSILDETGAYDSSTMQVRVPLVTLTKSDDEASRSYLETRIAWWVSDESQKAPVNVLATEEEFSEMESDSSKKRLMQALPFKNGMQALSMPSSSEGLFDVDLDTEDGRNSVRALNELAQLDLLQSATSSSVSAAKFLYNSVSMDTKGLAVNVRSGGLKKDLSVGLLARNPNEIESNPNYFDRPIGVEGYDAYLTNTIVDNVKTVNIFESNSLFANNKGHMFGPQAVENIDLSPVGLSYTLDNDNTDDESDIHEDPGGPLWDSLRDYYNNRVDKDGYDSTSNGSTGGYANKLRVKTDTTTGLSPVLLHYQLFVYPTLARYSSSSTRYGVRVYFIPIVVLWNPYDVPIAKDSVYAFRHGTSHADIIGSFRVAIGVKNGSSFDCIRDIRAEAMPRPSPNSSGSLNSGSRSLTSARYDMNAYRAVSFNEETVTISATTDGKNDGTTATSGAETEIAINKSYYGYGDWTYEDTQEYVSAVEESDYFPSSTASAAKLLDIRSAGLVRIYEEGSTSFVSRPKAGATNEISVSVPTHYYLSSDSFYFRRLYLNNLQYSLAFAPQVKMFRGGTTSLSESDTLDILYDYDGDEAIRFLVKNEEDLEPGAAKIFSLKCGVPYHSKFGGIDGYAGNFEHALSRTSSGDDDKWYLTEGIDKDKIGGFFVDIMHAEQTHLASAANGVSFGNKVETNTSFDISNSTDYITDPQKEGEDGMELGVLFDTSEKLSYTNEFNSDFTTVSINDICLDFDTWDVVPTDSHWAQRRYSSRGFASPYGYMRADLFNINPWSQASGAGTDAVKYSRTSTPFISGQTPNGLVLGELVMWDYSDDGGDKDLYLNEDASEPDDVYFGMGGAMPFQTLKRYSLIRPDKNENLSTSSFPEPLRIPVSRSGYYGYFYIYKAMAEFNGGAGSDENPGLIEQSLFQVNTTFGSYAINQTYSRFATIGSILDGDFSDIRDKVRGMNVPVFYKYYDSDNAASFTGTVYDVYYSNLMDYVNTQIETEYNTLVADGTTLSYTLDDYQYTEDDDGLVKFMSDLGLDEKYDGYIWIWEDPYFLLRNPRRIAYPRWKLSPVASSATSRDYTFLWRDNLPGSFNVQSDQIVTASNRDALTLDDITLNDGKSLVICEGISAYRPVSEELEDSYSEQENNEYFFQYQFKFPWLIHYNPTAKMYGDGVKANAGAFRDRSYGTSSSRGGSSDPHFFAYGAWWNNFQHSSFQYGGVDTTESGRNEDSRGNLNMDKWISFLIEKYGENQVQAGPDVLSENGYKYTLRRYLRDYEIVASPVDLATADLAFGTEQNRTFGLGTATPDMYYPANTIGSSYAPLRNAPERPYDYTWYDDHQNASTDSARSGDGLRDDDEIIHVTYDMSWNLNDLLWDEYFFSTVPYRQGEQNDMDSYYDYLIPKNPRIKYINTSKDKIYVRVNVDDMTSSEAVDNKIIISSGLSVYLNDSTAMNHDYDMNSERFWINGPFNVNSTNIDAWKMILATSFGNDIYGLSDETTSSSSSYKDKAPFPRNGTPYLAKEFDATTVRGNEQDAMQGFRALSREELEELAMSMVENVKDRGPFYSLADFVNRVVELPSAEMRRMDSEGYSGYGYDFTNYIHKKRSDEEYKDNIDEDTEADAFYLRQDHMQKGVMQAAIDLTSINQAFFDDTYLVDLGEDFASSSTDVGLNARFSRIDSNKDMSYAYLVWTDTVYYSTSSQETFWKQFGNPRNVWENYRASLGSTLAGAPTYLTQADILKQIGSFITVRGDTFKIRAYGEIRNPLSDEIESKAWCEMLVQRYPEYIDAVNNLATDIDNRQKELGKQNTVTDATNALLYHLEDNPVNKYLGRRFKVVSFKWLSERDI